MKISCGVALELNTTGGTSDVLRADDLMDQEFCIVLAIDIAAFAIKVIGILHFVLPHSFVSLEVLEAFFVGAFDFAAHLC